MPPKDLSTIEVVHSEAPNCSGEARTYGLILSFDEPVDPDSVELSALRQVTIVD